MQLFRHDLAIDFIKWSRLALIISVLAVLASIATLVVKKLNFGLDFTGGVLLELSYPQDIDPTAVRKQLENTAFADAIVQNFGTAKDVLLRLEPREGIDQQVLSTQIHDLLKQAEPNVELRRVEFVGPSVGAELAEQGILALLATFACILVYISLRFEWKLALSGVIALVHDTIITLGLFSIFGWEFDLTVLAALLAVIGYSLNDTIVVYDRIRENFRKIRKGTPEEIANASINQTLSRTTMTSFVTMLTVITLLFLGGELLRGFSIALIIGIVMGTYSSIYVASALSLMMGLSREDLIQKKVQKEGEHLGKV